MFGHHVRSKCEIGRTNPKFGRTMSDDRLLFPALVNPNLLWEMVKLKVREESLKYGTFKKKKLSKKEEEIEQAIATLEKRLSEFNKDETQREKVWLELETKKRELTVVTLSKYQTHFSKKFLKSGQKLILKKRLFQIIIFGHCPYGIIHL